MKNKNELAATEVHEIQFNIVEHPDMPGKFLQKRYDFVIFKNDKILIYPICNQYTHSKFGNLYRFKFPGVYPYSKKFDDMMSDSSGEFPTDVIRYMTGLNVEYVHNVNIEETIERYVTPVVYDDNVDTYEISGEYVKTFLFTYDDSDTSEYMKDCDIIDITEKYDFWHKEEFCYTTDSNGESVELDYDYYEFDPEEFYATDRFDGSLWVEYSYLAEKHASRDILSNLSGFAKNTTKISYDASDIISVVSYIDYMVHEFVYTNPAFSQVPKELLKVISNAITYMLIYEPVELHHSIHSPIEKITEDIVDRFDGFCINPKTNISMTDNADIFRVFSLINAFSRTDRLPNTAEFYRELQTPLDILCGVMGVMRDKYPEAIRVHGKLFNLTEAIEEIHSVFSMLAPLVQIQAYGKYSLELEYRIKPRGYILR